MVLRIATGAKERRLPGDGVWPLDPIWAGFNAEGTSCANELYICKELGRVSYIDEDLRCVMVGLKLIGPRQEPRKCKQDRRVHKTRLCLGPMRKANARTLTSDELVITPLVMDR